MRQKLLIAALIVLAGITSESYNCSSNRNLPAIFSDGDIMLTGT